VLSVYNKDLLKQTAWGPQKPTFIAG